MNKGLLNVDEALERLLAGARPVSETETVRTLSATGRVLAVAQRSTMNVPPMDNSAMDGYAVRIADLQRPDTRLKVTQKIPAGSMGKPLAPGTAARIFTGAPIPSGADAIVMQEHCTQEGDEVVVKKVPARGEWIRLTGSDIGAGGGVLQAGIRLRPQDTGLAASVGIASLPVFRRLRLGLFFTGDELVMPGDPLPPGRIYNSNRFTLNGLAGLFGCQTRDYGIVPDSLADTREVLRRSAAECDVIVTSGGVSVGEADFVKALLDKLGEVVFWKIAMKPGRPLAYGKIGAAHFFGLPGNPVSVMVTFYQFVRDALLVLSGRDPVPPLPTFKVPCTSSLKKAPGRTEFQRGILTQDAAGNWNVRVTGEQGSGILRSMSEANCFIILPTEQSNVTPGTLVDVQILEGLV
jgi:molybdopterin molybdotransferase